MHVAAPLPSAHETTCPVRPTVCPAREQRWLCFADTALATFTALWPLASLPTALLPLSPAPDAPSSQDLESLRLDLLRPLLPFLSSYVWSKDAFDLHASTSSPPMWVRQQKRRKGQGECGSSSGAAGRVGAQGKRTMQLA